MLYRIFSLVFISVGILSWSGCDTSEPDDNQMPPVGTSDAIIMHDGVERSYFLYVPENYTGNAPLPLVFNFHGYGSNGFEQMFYGNFISLAESNNFIVVHPQGTDLLGTSHWNVGGWTNGSTADDIGFTKALLDQLDNDYNIDLSRVYATGMSNGGYFSFVLACQESETFAAIASVTGSMTPETFDACNPKRPIPVMQIHGTSDETVPYAGETGVKPIVDVIDYWIGHNNCSPIGAETSLPDVDPTDGSTVDQFVFSGCDNQATVEHLRIIGGSHTWPGSTIVFPGMNFDIDGSEVVWEFFSKFDKNGPLN